MDNKTIYTASTVAEMTNGIILARFEKPERVRENYQSEAQLEDKLIEDLVAQGYERANINTIDELYKNLKIQLEKLNKINFTDSEWKRFLVEYLNCPNEGLVEKTRKVQEQK